MNAPEISDSSTPDEPRQAARARRSPESRGPTPNEPDPLEDRPEWSASPEGGSPTEFEDEAPGAYLEELGVRGWNVVWATLNLVLTLWIGLCALLGAIDAEWQFLAGVAWKLLPLSNALLLLITLWQRASAYTKNLPGRSRSTLILSLGALALWLALDSRIAIGMR